MTHEDLPFRSDFAGRVLATADIVAARRRKVRMVAASASAAIVTGAAMLGTWQMWMVRTPGPERLPREIASVDRVDLSYQPRTQTTLMDFMFPDAAPLTEFSDRYMDGENADELEDGAVFFPGADEDVAIDTNYRS